jgi:hypothetical protein
MADRLRKGSVRCAATMVCLQFCLHNLGPGLFGGESFHDKAAVLAFTSPAIRQIACDPGRGSSAFHDNAGTPSGHSMIMLARPVGHAQRALQVSGTIFAAPPSPQLGGPPGLWHHLRIGGESFHDKAAVLAFTSPAIRQIACDPGRGSSAFHDNAGTPSGGEGIEPGRAEEVLPGREARNDLGEVSADGEHQVSGTGRREDGEDGNIKSQTSSLWHRKTGKTGTSSLWHRKTGRRGRREHQVSGTRRRHQKTHQKTGRREDG